MAVIEKNLGPVSAYAVAVANGYEGTEEQWAAEIAAASQNAQAAAGSATEAAGSAAAAAQSVTDANNAKTAAQQAAESASAAYGTDLLAATFAADAPYVSGQYVIYNGGLYVFTADHPAGAWIGTDARRAQVGGELTDLKSAFASDISGFVFETANDKYTSGKYHNVEYRVTGNTVKLNGTANGGFRLKLSGSNASVSNKIEDDWKNESLGLINGHQYMMCIQYVSGSGDRAGIGINGPSSETLWINVDPNSSTPNATFFSEVFMANATNSSFLYVYTSTNRTHSNLVFRFNLIDITASQILLNEKLGLTETGLNSVKDYIKDYICDRNAFLAAVDVITGNGDYTYENLAISVCGNRIVLNGSCDTSVRVKLTNGVDVSHSWKTAWQSETVPVLNASNKHAIALACISGSAGTAYSRVSVSDNSGALMAAAYITDANGYKTGVKYSLPIDSLEDACCLYIYFSAGCTFANVVLQCNLVDLTVVGQMIDNASGSDDNALHSYYFANDYIDERMNAIIDIRAASSINSESFVWFTDPHYYRPSVAQQENGMQSAQIIEYMRKQVNIRWIFCGGDMLRGTLTKAVCREYFKKTRSYLEPIYSDLFMALGNHEYNNVGDNTENELSTPELYEMFVKHQEMMFDSYSEKGDYTFTNDAQHVRYFVIGCTRTGAIFTQTIAWLADTLTHVESGYHVIIISHVGMKIDGSHEIATAFEPICEIIDAVNTRSSYTYSGITYNYSGVNCEIVCALTGHTHFDGYATTNSGVPIIETMSDKSFTDQTSDAGLSEVRTIGTIGEQSVNYVLIDFDAHKIHMIRIGGSYIGAAFDSDTGKIYDAEVGTGTEYTGPEWVAYSPYKDQHFDYTSHLN